MRTVELIEEAQQAAQRMGYSLRHEYLGGSGGGACEFAGRRWIFIDLALTIDEQFEQLVESLRGDPALHLQSMSDDLRSALDLRRSA